jgi:hypothetical protein
MFSEDEVFLDPNDIVHIIWVVLFKIAKDAKFDTCLMLEPLFIADNFCGNNLICFVVFAFQGLPKAAFTQKV